MMGPLTVLLVVAVLAGCDRDNDDGGFTSVDSETSASELTEQQSETFCSEATSYLEGRLTDERQMKMTCILSMMIGSGLSQGNEDTGPSCQEAYNECINDDELRQPQDRGSFSCPIEDGSDCSAPIGDIEACVVAVSDSLVDTIDNFSCSDIDSEGGRLIETPEACSSIQDECPGLYRQMNPM